MAVHRDGFFAASIAKVQIIKKVLKILKIKELARKIIRWPI